MVNIIYRDRQVAVEEEGRVKYYNTKKRSKAAGRVYIPAETLGDISAMKTKRVSEMHICEGEVSTCSIIVALHVSCLRH